MAPRCGRAVGSLGRGRRRRRRMRRVSEAHQPPTPLVSCVSLTGIKKDDDVITTSHQNHLPQFTKPIPSLFPLRCTEWSSIIRSRVVCYWSIIYEHLIICPQPTNNVKDFQWYFLLQHSLLQTFAVCRGFASMLVLNRGALMTRHRQCQLKFFYEISNIFSAVDDTV